MSKTYKDRHDYFMRRSFAGCTGCGEAGVGIDPVSALCPPCKKRMLIHGSPRRKKPKLTWELEKAHFGIVGTCDIRPAEKVFNEFMVSYASPNKHDPLRRLCWLHFFQLKASDGKPLMSFFESLLQTFALILYETNGGRFDAKKKQYQYCLGRAAVCPWDRRRQSARGTYYDKQERVELQKKPTIMLRAFDEIFIGAGIGRFITNINNKIRRNKNGSSDI
jgi:hypothetical protein